MLRFYCTADGAGPRPCPDWSQVEDETARQNEPGHVARSGWGPRTYDLHPRDVVALPVDLGESVDEHGGRLASVTVGGVLTQLRCPECLAAVRAVEVIRVDVP